MVVIARLRNFNMVHILCISSCFNIVTYFTTFTDKQKYVKHMVLVVIRLCSSLVTYLFKGLGLVT